LFSLFLVYLGPAVGVGITMTLPMDIRVVNEDAKIGFELEI